MKYLITGISGFVAGHLVEYLCRNSDVGEIVGIDVIDPDFSWLDEPSRRKINFFNFSLLEMDTLANTINETQPDYIVHLASLSSVADSWKYPAKSFINNTNIFLNLVETVRVNKLKTRILSVGSSEEYGVVSADKIPLNEDIHINPMNPYAVARVSQEYLSRIYAKGFGIPIVCTRSFNHLGPRQKETYVISSFVKQAVEVKFKLRSTISCGNLSIVRDFIDVRDVVKCYVLLLDKGDDGEIYNVCSNQGYVLQDILHKICNKVNISRCYSGDRSLLRPIDNPIIVGDNRKILKLGANLDYSMDRSLDDVVDYWLRTLDRNRTNTPGSSVIFPPGR